MTIASSISAPSVPPPYDGFLFIRGYVFCDRAIEHAPEDWTRAVFGGFNVAFDRRLPAHAASTANVEILCLGLIYDCRNPDYSAPDCIQLLLSALARSEEEYLAELDFMGGRFVVAYREPNGKLFHLSDATGMKSSFYYHRERRVIASHAMLAALNAESAAPRDELPLRFGYPGHWTPYEHVYVLTPNTKLDLEDFKPKRFWPNRPVAPMSVPEAAEASAKMMGNALAHLCRHHDPIVSVTAGIDSRTTLALTRRHPEIRYFTYYRDDKADTDKLDKEFAVSLQNSTNVRIEIINRQKPNEDYFALLRQLTYYRHLPGMSYAYFKRHAENPGALHVRSNLSEIARQFYANKKPFRPVNLGSALDIARLWGGKRNKKKFTFPILFKVIDAFEEFDRATGLTNCPYVDHSALFYWEHRMGLWHAQVVTESDPAFDTTSLYNARAILKTLLAVAPEQQKKSAVLKCIIRSHWPELCDFPLNGVPFDKF